MDETEGRVVLIVRGAGPAGRRIAEKVVEAGATPVVLDERTCAHENVEAVRVPFVDPASPRRAVHDIMVRYGRLDALVLLPAPPSTVDAMAGATLELALGEELTLVAGLVRTAAPALAAAAGVVVAVSAPSEPPEPTVPGTLLTEVSEPVIHTLGERYGFRVAPVDTRSLAALRGADVANAVVDRLGMSSPSGRSGHQQVRAGRTVVG